jgi:hypothetical protein
LKYSPRDADRKAGVALVSRHELRGNPHWQHAFASQHKDHRYYDLIDETIHPEFQYLYFVLRDSRGRITAIQPFFIVEQDILTGVRPYVGRAVDLVRKLWPRFMFMKSMMVGCVAGEAHLDDASDIERATNAELLAQVIEEYARELAAPLIVLKEFPASYREILSCFERRGFTRIPSMPLTRLNIAYSSFDEYMQLALNSATRSKLRKKFRASEDVPIELHVSTDVTQIIDEVFPHVNVYRRSAHFESSLGLFPQTWANDAGRLLLRRRYSRPWRLESASSTAIPCTRNIWVSITVSLFDFTYTTTFSGTWLGGG